MASLFLSHSSHDRAVVDDLRRRLSAEGFDAVFLDFDPDRGIPAGRNWESELYSALQRSDALLFVATESSVNSRWCFAEIALARSVGKVVFPVRMSDAVTHALLNDIQWVDVAAEGDLAYARLWAVMKDRGLDPSASFDWDPKRPPFPGLAAFTPDDAAVFFGRFDLVNDLISRIEARRRQQGNPFLTIVGPSGSGKSSLIRAGLLPRLLRRRSEWVVVDPFSPGSRPVSALARALAVALSGSPNDRVSIEQRLREEPADFAELMKDLTAGREGGPTAVLLVVDQTEELIRREDTGGPAGSDRSEFMNILLRSPRKDPNVQIVSSLRSEFLGAIVRDSDLAALVHEPVVVGPLPRSQLPAVIEGPAQRAGIRFDPGLVQRIVEETRGGEALPLLGYALQQLYQQRQPDGLITMDTYMALGGVEGALRQRADEVQEALQSEGYGDVIIPALLRLVAIDDHDEPLRRPVAIDTFTEAQRKVINAFVEARLLITDSAGGSAVALVAHETLFWAWPPIRAAIAVSREALRTQTELERLARDWARAGRRDSYLLRGDRLRMAELWLDSHTSDVTQAKLLRDFVDRSRTGDLAALRRESELVASRVLTSLNEDPERGILVSLAAIEEYAPTPEITRALDTSFRSSRIRVYLKGHEGPVNSVTYSPDGSRIVTASDDTTARIWSVTDQREIAVLRGHSARVRSAEYSRDATRIVTASDDGTAKVWDATDGRIVVEIATWEPYWAAFSPNGRLIAIVAGAEDVSLWDATSGKRLADEQRPYGGPFFATGTRRDKRFSLAFSPNGDRIANGSLTSVADVWKVVKSRKLRHLVRLEGHGAGKAVHSVTFSPEGNYILTGSADGTAQIWDLAKRQQRAILEADAGEIYFAAFSTDGSMIVTAGQDGVAWVWDTAEATRLLALPGHHSAVLSAAFSPDDTEIVTGARDGIVRLWDTTDRGGILPINHERPVYSASFSSDESRILTAAGRSGNVFDASDGSPVVSTSGHADTVMFASFSPDGSRIVTASEDYSARVWNSTGAQEFVLADDFPVQLATFSLDGSRIITSAGGRGIVGDYIAGSVKVWEASSGQLLFGIPSAEDESVRSAVFSPDRSRIVAAVGALTARIWDADTRQLQLTLTGHDNLVNYAEFSLDGSLIVTASDDGTARIWDAADGKEQSVLRGHRAQVNSARFAPDGSRIVTASADGTALVWDTATAKPVCELWHGAVLAWATFSPSGMHVLTAGGDGVVWVWEHFAPDELISVARSRVFRALTAAERQEYGLPERVLTGPPTTPISQ